MTSKGLCKPPENSLAIHGTTDSRTHVPARGGGSRHCTADALSAASLHSPLIVSPPAI